MSDDSYERQVIEYESALNEAMDKWFSARPNIERDADVKYFFEAGFRMAWRLHAQQRLMNMQEGVTYYPRLNLCKVKDSL